MKWLVYESGEQYDYNKERKCDSVHDSKEKALARAFQLIDEKRTDVEVEETLEHFDHYELKELKEKEND